MATRFGIEEDTGVEMTTPQPISDSDSVMATVKGSVKPAVLEISSVRVLKRAEEPVDVVQDEDILKLV
uniref:Uncharacterized protein n=1 Tax=Globisporangium ultimum (strain ATCC 200006 / CBS 805.95 / DAOM BR144) TaxID=431595 RepID=K3WYJ0_GLOUD